MSIFVRWNLWRSRAALLLALGCGLSACGGGGGDTKPADASAPASTVPGDAPSAPVIPGGAATDPLAPGGAATGPVVPGATAPNPPPAPDPNPAPAGGAPAATVLRLPLEVLGDGSPKRAVIAEAKLGLESGKLGAVAQLWFQCHRCGFYGAPEFEATTATPVKIKASVRVLGGVTAADEAGVPWIDITDASVKMGDDERLHGGINGGLYTTRLTLALDAATRARLVALPAYNRVQFRFNGTDGESNGFRVLKLQLQDAAAADVGSNSIEQFDPMSERDTSKIGAADAAAGKALWLSQGTLAKSAIVSRPIQAACASCHAVNGRDLQYFNYSNNSIIQRSRYHGLSEVQGKQIAAYIRTAMKDIAYVAKARPWNPPYQPGPGLDCKDAGCATAWSAGAGLDAVISTPADSLKAIFGKPLNQALALSQADVDQVMNPAATMNAREMPVALQFPDWNAWLPTIHPRDVWPARADGGGSFEAGAQFAGGGVKKPNTKYLELIDWLNAHKNPNGKAGDWSHLTADQRVQIKAMFTQSGWEGYQFLGGGRGDHIAPDGGQYGAQVGGANLQKLAAAGTTSAGPAAGFSTNSYIERAVASFMHWNAIKQWEMAQDFALEGNQQWFIGDKDAKTGLWKGRGEAHGWPFNTVSLFFLAPHMIYQSDRDASGKITREWYNAWEANNIVASYYRSNQWYQLQMIVNAGGQSDWVNFPMDWPYLTAFEDLIAGTVGTKTPAAKSAHDAHIARLLQARIKSAQYANNEIVLYDPAQPDLFANRGRYGRGQIAKHLSTSHYLDWANPDGVSKSNFLFLDAASPGLYLKVVNGSIRQFNALYSQQPISAWRRCDINNTQLGEPEPYAGFRYCLDPVRTPLGKYSDGSLYMTMWQYRPSTEQMEQYGLWKATQLGADPARLKVWSDWIDAAWPKL